MATISRRSTTALKVKSQMAAWASDELRLVLLSGLLIVAAHQRHCDGDKWQRDRVWYGATRPENEVELNCRDQQEQTRLHTSIAPFRVSFLLGSRDR